MTLVDSDHNGLCALNESDKFRTDLIAFCQEALRTARAAGSRNSVGEQPSIRDISYQEPKLQASLKAANSSTKSMMSSEIGDESENADRMPIRKYVVINLI